MSEAYFVSVPQPSGATFLKIADFRSALMTRWPSATVRALAEASPYAFEWSDQDSQIVEGKVDRLGSSVVLKGSLAACAVVALWLRNFVGAGVPLAFFDADYSASVLLSAHLLPEDVVAKMEQGALEI